jgi:hypothetical protein
VYPHANTHNAARQLSVKRRVTVQGYKGTTLVALREYYQKDGKDLPGKQGIALTVEQFSALVLALPDIKAVLAEKGIAIPDGAAEEEPDEHDLEAPDEVAEEETDEET